jgi:hypothetical protein
LVFVEEAAHWVEAASRKLKEKLFDRRIKAKMVDAPRSNTPAVSFIWGLVIAKSILDRKRYRHDLAYLRGIALEEATLSKVTLIAEHVDAEVAEVLNQYLEIKYVVTQMYDLKEIRPRKNRNEIT